MTRHKRTLQLDKQNAKWLGVCAGLANFLEVEAWTVRLVFLGCVFFGGWFLVPLYFISWYLLDEKSGQKASGKSRQMKDTIMENPAVRHFRTVDYRKKLYRNTRDGKLWGVCAGIADYLEINAFAVRMAFLLLTCLTGFPVLFYLGALLVLEKKPEEEYAYEARSRTWTSQFQREEAGSKAKTGDAGHTREDAPAAGRQSSESRRSERSKPRDQYSQRREFQYCARKFTALKQRLARIEAYVTSNRFKLHREFRNMS